MKHIFKAVCSLIIITLIYNRLSAQDLCTPIGWAALNGGTSGGGSASPVTVSTLADLQTQANSAGAKVIYVSGIIGAGVTTRVPVAANKTIIGLPGATLIGGFDVKNNNVIIRNMKIQGPGSVDVNGVDCIAIDGANNVWIDHCDIYDGQDGNMDITNGANYVAVTWCKFSYTSASTNHQFCNLLGNSDSKISDRGKLKITMMYNWWTSGCVERMPRVRFGQVHVVNNYFNSRQTSYCVRAGIEADILVESNYIDSVSTPIDLYQNNFTAVTSRNNVFNATSGNNAGSGVSFTPPYQLIISPAANIKSIVSNPTCGAGATMQNPTTCNCNSSTTIYTLLTNTNPLIGGSVNGSGSYNAGSFASVTATPSLGYTFSGWTGDTVSSNASISLFMNGNKNITANFTANVNTSVTITTAANPSIGGTVSGGGTFNIGNTVTLTATPNSGYTFLNWSGDTSATGSTLAFTANSNKSINANFQLIPNFNTNLIRIEDTATSLNGLCSYDGVISANSGANNTRVINLSNSIGRAITWKINIPSDGNYTFNWRYVNSSASNTYAMKFSIDTSTINGNLPFPKTTSSTTFSNTIITVFLYAGIHSIKLESIAASATADIDWLEISGNRPIVANCSSKNATIQVNCFLQGAYITNGIMKSTLYDLGISNNTNASDTISIQLWKPTNLSDSIPEHSTNVVLLKTGVAYASFPFYIVGNSYYLVIKNRNHMETWSAAPLTFTDTTKYDFSTAATKAFSDGFNPPMKRMADGKFAFYTGDINQDGGIDILDLQIEENDVTNFLFGYNISDCTGDGASDIYDIQNIENNSTYLIFRARP
jgi:pectate lyase